MWKLIIILSSLITFSSTANNESIISNFGDQHWFSSYFDPINNIYPSIECNDHIPISISNQEMAIYKIELTSSILEFYRHIQVSTCCNPIGYETDNNYNGSYAQYCDIFTSLDTVLYLFQYDNNPSFISQESNISTISVQLLATNDDDIDNQCYEEYNDTTKSMIHLFDYPPDTYYIAISGNNGNSGLAQLNLICDLYSWPLEADEFMIDINTNQSFMQCDDIFYNQTNTEQNPISYYQINIDQQMEVPAIITTCHPLYEGSNNYSKYDTFLYLLKQIGETEMIFSYSIVDINDVYILPNGDKLCDGYGSQLDLTHFVETKQYGTYYVAVGANMNMAGLFALGMSCGIESESPDVTMLIIVLSVVFIFCVIFCTFYYLQLKRLKSMDYDNNNNNNNDNSLDGNISTDTDKDCGGSIEDNTFDIGRAVDNNYIDIDIEDDNNENKCIDEEEDDPIIYTMRSIISSLENHDGLDIYQVLAFRAIDKKSRRMKVKKPLSKFRININILYLSSFQRVLYVAMTVFSLQVIGITVIMYSVSFAKYNTDRLECYYHGIHWGNNRNWIYKLLAFLWASVITLNIGIHQNRMRESGFTKIIDQIPNNMYPLIDCVDIVILHIGLLSNLYTLLIAVAGSYFIIFTSAGGADAMDMVLNAVALFFMIELDDMLVTKNDYRDISNGCKTFLEKYINEKNENIPCIKDQYRFNTKRQTQQTCGIKGMSRLTICVEYFGVIIAGITVLSGFIAPILILICYDGFSGNQLDL